MEEMEGVTSGRRPGQEHPGRPGHSHREYERIYSKGNPSVGEEGEDWHHNERWRKKITDTEESSHSKGGRILNSFSLSFSLCLPLFGEDYGGGQSSKPQKF